MTNASWSWVKSLANGKSFSRPLRDKICLLGKSFARWLFDSGATNTFRTISLPSSTQPPIPCVLVSLAVPCFRLSVYSVSLKTTTSGKFTRFVHIDVQYFPTIPRSLLSASKLIDHKFVVSFSNHCTIYINDQIVARAPHKYLLWPLSAVPDTVDEAAAFLTRDESATLANGMSVSVILKTTNILFVWLTRDWKLVSS